MPRPCGPCSDKKRYELDRRLLEMDISHESYRTISLDFGYSVDALKRHKANHLSADLAEIKQAMETARDEALEKVKVKELQDIQTEAKEGIAIRLKAAASYFDQLKELRDKAANLLDACEASKDLKSCIGLLRELREQIRLAGELEGKIKNQVNVNVTNIWGSQQWVEVGEALAEVLGQYPEVKVIVAKRLLELAEAHQ